MELEYKSYDQLLQEALEYKQAGSALIWAEAEAAFQAVDVMGTKPGQWAADTGYSNRHVYSFRKTYAAFADPDRRVIDPFIGFTHHTIAAGTEDPYYWIEQAAENSWSTRQMQKAIKGETIKDELQDAEAAWARVQKILEQGGPGAEWLHLQIMQAAVS